MSKLVTSSRSKYKTHLTASVYKKIGKEAAACEERCADDVDTGAPKKVEESPVKIKTHGSGTSHSLGFGIKSIWNQRTDTNNGATRHFIVVAQEGNTFDIENGDEILTINDTKMFGMGHNDILGAFPVAEQQSIVTFEMTLRRWIEVAKDPPKYEILLISLEVKMELKDGRVVTRANSTHISLDSVPMGGIQRLHFVSKETMVVRDSNGHYLAKSQNGNPDILIPLTALNEKCRFIVSTYTGYNELPDKPIGEEIFVGVFQSEVDSTLFLHSNVKNKSDAVQLTHYQSSNIDHRHVDERFFIKRRLSSGDAYIFESLLYRGHLVQRENNHLILVKDMSLGHSSVKHNSSYYFQLFPPDMPEMEEFQKPELKDSNKSCFQLFTDFVLKICRRR